jgi:hypothetical protein
MGNHEIKAITSIEKIWQSTELSNTEMMHELFNTLDDRGDVRFPNYVRVQVLCYFCRLPNPVQMLPCRHLSCEACLRKLSYECTDNTLEGVERINCCRRPIRQALIYEAFGGQLNFEIKKNSAPLAEKFVCPIDTMEHLKDFGVSLYCGHTIFIDMLQQHLRIKITQKSVLGLGCPVCNVPIEPSEIFKYISRKESENYSRYLLELEEVEGFTKL